MDVINLSSYREKKDIEKSISRDRIPLHVSHIDERRNRSPYLKHTEADSFGERMFRIKQSLEKINQLMSELKKADPKKNQ